MIIVAMQNYTYLWVLFYAINNFGNFKIEFIIVKVLNIVKTHMHAI